MTFFRYFLLDLDNLVNYNHIRDKIDYNLILNLIFDLDSDLEEQRFHWLEASRSCGGHKVKVLVILILLHFTGKRYVTEIWFKYHWICLCPGMFGKVFDFANSHSFDRSGRKQHKSKLCSISVDIRARIFKVSHLAASQSRPHFVHLHFCCISYQFAAIRPERSNGCDFRRQIRISETIYRRKSCNTSPKRA